MNVLAICIRFEQSIYFYVYSGNKLIVFKQAENWYDFAIRTFEKLTYAGEKFVGGDLGNKKDILLAIGQNPKLLDGKLQITPNEWLMPVAKNAKRIRAELEKVRMMPQQMQKALKEALRTDWCRVRDSNPRTRRS